MKPIIKNKTNKEIDSKKIKLNRVNKYGNLYLKNDSKGNKVIINNDTKFQLGSLYFDMDSDKSLKRFIKTVEGLVRVSNEYKKYISIVKDEYGLKNDMIMSNITDDMATTEYHHYPFTLYEITEIVVNKKIMEDEQFTSISVAEDILKLHFDNKVGLVLLTKTNHQLAHAGKILIPMSSVFGNVNEFINDYKEYIMDQKVEMYNELVDKTDI